ncbi:MerR family transcriptional regulator [Actinomadura xylanilytica]|uniref:MerR family transcriptional regulator n=1 Tax=Actinomadura xylanilytica TaxID=887459 RepID=UPI00255A8157|nr:MerR family transcriptional regulator [Actinomadura xylanilytica]MDL4772112.1 MerR family transcriptional regulator [Actinomadura xylanilytica]
MAGVGLSVGAVARRLGVPPSTLRTWGRRYGIGPSRHSAGGHRRYDDADVARLELMNRLILDGVPPEEAARSALATETGTLPPAIPSLAGSAKGRGGHRLTVPDATPATRALARAALAMDTPTMRDLIGGALRRDGAERAWQELLAPVLIGIGDRHAATGAIIEVEHVLSGCIRDALAAEAAAQAAETPPLTARPVLLACAPEEQHSLPLYALGAALAGERISVRVLGARVPARALGESMRRLGPAAVFVWSQTSWTGDPAPLAELPGSRPPARLIIGGPGWEDGRLPASAHRVGSLPAALAEVRAALGRA